MALQLSGSDPMVVFSALAVLIFLGFLGNVIFSRLRFNDTLILIAVGVLVGPVLAWVAIEPVQRLSSIVGPLALILILFDGGLALRLRDLARGLGSAVGLAFIGFALTAGLVAVILHYTLTVDTVDAAGNLVTIRMPYSTGLILGAILGGTSALVVLPTLANMKVEQKTATTLGLESALTDVLVVVMSFTLMSIVAAGTGPDAQGITSSLLTIFIMSLVLGMVAGLLWLWLIPHVRRKPFGYMLTLGVMFGLYVITEGILEGAGVSEGNGGGGPLAVLAFGIVLGNHGSMGRRLAQRVGEGFGEGIKKFQGEIAFLVRTFFFVYLGILVEIELFKDLRMWAIGILLFAAMMIARYIAVAITNGRLRLRGEDWVVWSMMPRGLAAAVLAAIPFQEFQIEGTKPFVGLAFLLLVLTNLSATIAGMAIARAQAKGWDPNAVAPEGRKDDPRHLLDEKKRKKAKRG